jgi:hypothetical protein
VLSDTCPGHHSSGLFLTPKFEREGVTSSFFYQLSESLQVGRAAVNVAHNELADSTQKSKRDNGVDLHSIEFIGVGRWEAQISKRAAHVPSL